MNILLWILQILLGAHTAVGAFWKFSHSEQAVPSLSLIPHNIWMALSVLEIVCALVLMIPLYKIRKSFGSLPPAAAILVALEMLLFCGAHLASRDPNPQPMIYWLVVAIFSSFVAYGRMKMKPLG